MAFYIDTTSDCWFVCTSVGKDCKKKQRLTMFS